MYRLNSRTSAPVGQWCHYSIGLGPVDGRVLWRHNGNDNGNRFPTNDYRVWYTTVLTTLYMAVWNDCKDTAKDLDQLCFWEDKWKMEFHPEKWEILMITRKRSPLLYPYQIHGQRLKHADHAKYLGVNISTDMCWNKHMITAKVNSKLGFVKRNVNISHHEVKAQAYKSVHCVRNKTAGIYNNNNNIQICKAPYAKLQRRWKPRAAIFSMSRYRRTSSVGAMLQELNWESLASRRHAARLVMLYKIHYRLVAVNMPLESKHHTGPTRKENSVAYHVPSSSVNYQKNSFFYCAVRDWNCLPEETVHASSPESFRAYISA